jgi:hypothetical protein
MRLALRTVAGAAVLAVAALPAAAPAATSGHLSAAALVPVTQVLFDMNEPAEATTMLDSSGNGLDTPIDQAGLDTGEVYNGATGYRWLFRAPAAPPASPERVIQVADNPLLDPGGDTFTVEIRFRTKEKFGNIIQKGQSASRGGQWKIQNPKGLPSCLFKDSVGRRTATQSKVALNDNEWHTLTCVRTTASVTMYVDGVYMNRKLGTTGTIDNTIPMTIAGKINCDQITVTCDYFSGMIDYVKLTRGT